MDQCQSQISGETFHELSRPLVHTDFPGKTRHQGVGPYGFPLNSSGPMAAKSLRKFWSTTASVHRLLFPAFRPKLTQNRPKVDPVQGVPLGRAA